MTKFKFRQRLKNRLKSTKLKSWLPRNPYSSGMDIAGNSSDIIQKIGQIFDIGLSTGGCYYSGSNFGHSVANVAEDYACADYKCLALDCVSTACDTCAFACSAFLPKNNVTGGLYATFIGVSKASKTIRNRCKEAGGFCK